MDLIYMNERKEDVGILQDYSFDLAYGVDENNFELTVNTNNHVCEPGNIIYIENTEYGGVIDRIKIRTDANELTYAGRTWHGILSTKILEPDAGQDYLILSGEANTVLASLITRLGLSTLFKASTTASGITIKNYQMNRYIDGYNGIKKMLASVKGKLKVSFQGGFVIISADPAINYSKDEEFDSSQMALEIEKNYKPANHVICLGRGDLKEREVFHLYADSKGNISNTQTQFGLNEVVTVYENTNCETEELRQGGIDKLLESRDGDSVQVNFDGAKNYDIGDIVGARENITGVFVAREIVKKIVIINRNDTKITYKVG